MILVWNTKRSRKHYLSTQGLMTAGFDYTYICYRKVLTTLDFQTLCPKLK